MNFLIVQEDKSMREQVKNLLLNYNFCRQVYPCTSADEAINILTRTDQDIIIVGSKEGKNRGLSIIREAEAIDQGIQFIIFTDWTNGEILEKYKSDRIQFLSTPINEEELIFKLKTAVDRRKAFLEYLRNPQKYRDPQTTEIAERKQVEQALKDSEMKFRTLFESSSDAIMILDRKEFFDCNQATLKIFGYSSKKEFINKHPCDLSPLQQPDGEDSFSAANKHIEEAFRDGTKFYQWIHRRKDGSVFPAEVLLSRFNLKGRNVLQAVVRDITERKQFEEELQKREQEFKALVENAPDIIARFDQDYNCIYVNPAVERELGICREEFVLKNKHILGMPEGEASRMLQQDVLKMVFDSQEEKNIYTYYLTNQGKKYFYTRIVPEFTIDGNIETVLSITRDITDRRMAEEVLRKTKEQYQKLVEQLPDAIIIHHEHQVVFANTVAAKLLGVEGPDELIGQSILKYLPEDYWDIVKTLNKKVAEEGSVMPLMEQKIIHSGKEIIDIEVTSIPITYQGRPEVLSVIRDITERKRMETEMQKTGKLESIGILAGGIAHDFNNILTIILGNISLSKFLIKKDHKVFKKLLEIEKASMQAKELTQQLHTFAKGGEPMKKTVSLKELVRDAVTFSLSGSNVRSEFDFTDSILKAEVDEGQIRQVINNLILNAVQAMPDGGIIKVRANNIVVGSDGLENYLPLPYGNYVEITVEDRGVGIEERYMQKIFDPFFTTKETGTGLGLTISYSIVKKHGGYISVDSCPGEGSRFRIYLPASFQENKEEKKEKNVYYGGQGKVLVMDDEKKIRDVAGEMLSVLGYESDFARDGAEALDMYIQNLEEGKPFDLVIMDLTIPGGMGGKETIKRLLKIDPKVKAIVSSGYSNDPVMSYYREYGFSGVVSKPYKIEELAEVISKFLHSKRENA